LKVNGKFEGTLDTKGNLTIADTATVNARIIGDNIMISGRVKGQIIAREKLEFSSTAIVEGDIQPSKLSIGEGAIFEGNCHMLKSSFNSEELARYLEVEVNSILEWANSGKVPAVKEGNDWRFERKAIDEWLAAGKLH
jgi:excisionase family DNA binding protein